MTDEEHEFLIQSNHIEGEYSDMAHTYARDSWEYAKGCAGYGVFTLENIKYIHYLMMRGLNMHIAGRWRECSVTVGGCLKPFISTDLIMGDVGYMVRQIKKNKLTPKEAHINFEYIHPFEDGNGRVGRILYNAHRRILSMPIEIIWEQEKHEYYKWFSND